MHFTVSAVGSLTLAVLFVTVVVIRASDQQAALDGIALARKLANDKINDIRNEWQIDAFPYFLRSSAMHKSSWEMMKHKYMLKILMAARDDMCSKFVVSFLGSSVTAGTDSPAGFAYPDIVGVEMAPSFEAVNVEFESRNAGFGNNPCIPYDICVAAFAGRDADVVHWEQSYYCSNTQPWIYEQFIRGSMQLPTRPIVVFDTSETGNWKPEECVTHTREALEEQLLRADALHIVAELNRPDYERWFLPILSHEMYKKYEGAGLQTFFHWETNRYACQGPYIQNWVGNVHSWHPSVLGHRMRAHQFAYFWLKIWIDALESTAVLLEYVDARLAYAQVEERVNAVLQRAPIDDPIFESVFPDRVKCYTEYHPRFDPAASLKDRVVAGLAGGTGEKRAGPGWVLALYDDLMAWTDEMVHELGEKWLLYGDALAGPLSLALTVDTPGKIFLCSPPTVGEVWPSGFDSLYGPSAPDVYLTPHVEDRANFVFDREKALKMELWHDKVSKIFELCSEVRPADSVPVGEHVLTVSAKGPDAVMLAFLLTP